MAEETYIGTRSLEYALLGFLYEQPCNAISLHQQVVTELGYIWKISRSQTYAILKRLMEQGYVTSNTAEQEKLSPGELFQITKRGDAASGNGWKSLPAAVYTPSGWNLPRGCILPKNSSPI